MDAPVTAPESSALPDREVLPDRAALRAARRIIVKVGSRTLRERPELPEELAEQLATLVKSGKSAVLVSSGAVALGMGRLGLTQRPTEVAWMQAAASAGQSILMRRYDEVFQARGIPAAQVLLTHADLADRTRLNNARGALAALLEAGAVPIINENDVVATEELRFSDNDQLSAMVAPLVGADALLLLTDVEGVLDAEGERIRTLTDRSQFLDRGAVSGAVGRGGMSSKLDAAFKARRSGASVVIANARRPRVVLDVLDGLDVGTYFPPTGSMLRARQHWIAYTLRPTGTVLVDAGARAALETGQKSLLPIGVLGLRGEFHPGDSVRITDGSGHEIGRGLSRLSSTDLARAAGKKGEELVSALGGTADQVVVHKDDLVLSE